MNRLTKPRSAMIAAALATGVTWTQPLSAGQVDITVTGVTAPTGFIMIGVADAAGANEFPVPKPGPPTSACRRDRARLIKP